MGLGGISMGELLVILAIVVVLFGTKRLSTLGSDLGTAIRGFRKAMSKEDETKLPPSADRSKGDGEVLNGETTRSEEKR